MNKKATPTLMPPALPASCSKPEDVRLHGGAPPVVRNETADLASALSAFDRQLEAERRHQPVHGKRDSASWLGSIALHGVLIALLALLLAPADFGGIQTHLLYLSFSDQDPVDEASFQIAAAEEDEPAPLPADQPAETIALPAEVLPSANSSGASSGDQTGDGADGQQAAPRGSFFGIQADGHEFVYVLDMSGSMEGRRFKRATAELVRSVGGLRESQNFYVLLFNGSTVQMFDQRGLRPTPISATEKNKEKLSQWLKTAFQGGSTDPRDALRIALRMNPSAVFMLSDGEFDDQKKGRRRNLLGGDTDAFSIVAAATGKVPIHAVAFEDPNSCANMKRLATMTGGEYRYSEQRSALAAKQALTQARDAFVRGDDATGELLMRDVIETYGQTDAGWTARKELADQFYKLAQQGLKDGRLGIVKESLVSMVEIDPQRVVTKDLQQGLVSELLRRSQAYPEQKNEITEVLAGVMNRFPQSKTAISIQAPVAGALLRNARALIAAGDQVGAMRKLELVIRQFPQTSAADDGKAERTKIVDAMLAEAKELHPRSEVGYVTHLRVLVAKYRGTELEVRGKKALEALAMEMVCKARDASLQRNTVMRNLLNQRLREGFGNDQIVKKVRRDLSRDELRARELMREGARLEKRDRDQAVQQYEEIVKSYANTLAAEKAGGRLRDLQPGGASRDEELSELVEMMR